MAIELKIPGVGESISEVQIADWLKADGDLVKKDENVATIDSEKTTLELAATATGRLKILRQAGETVKIGETIAEIEAEAGEAEAGKPKTEPARKEKAAEKKEETKSEATSGKKVEPAVEIKPETPVKPEASAVEKTLSAPAIARDVEPKPAGPREKIVPMTMLRRTAARRLVEAKQQMAMLTTFNEIDVSAMQSLRKELREDFEKRHQIKLGMMSFFVKAAVAALKQFPKLNAEIRGNDIVYHGSFDIGVAIASERGLVVPTLAAAGEMNFPEIEKAIADFALRAKDGKLKAEELSGGTFTITNGGIFGSLFSTPILNPPQTGILGMHTIQERPVALNGQVVIRPMMYVALTYDHRLVDGREAVLFLQAVKADIENPSRLLVGI